MKKRRSTQSSVEGARALLDRIEETGFLAHYSMLGDGNVRQYDWEKIEAKLSGVEKGLWRFLLMGEALSKAEATRLLGRSGLAFLQRNKLCVTSKGKLSLGTLRLVRLWGLTFFVERSLATLAYLGDDTKALLAIVPRLTRGRCLSLYTAGGVEVMPLIAGTKVEINFAEVKASEGILRANLELNSAHHDANLWQLSRNGQGSYDLIVSNPPCYIQAPGVKLPTYVSGGPDGLKCVRRVLDAARDELVPGGQLLMTFAFCAEMDSSAMEERLRALLDPYGLNYLVTVSSKLLMEPGVPIFNHLISTVRAPGPEGVQTAVHKTMAHIERKKLTAAHLLSARLWKPKPSEAQDRQITNYSDFYYGTWTI